MRKATKKCVSFILATLIMFGVFVGLTPVKNVSAAANPVQVKNLTVTGSRSTTFRGIKMQTIYGDIYQFDKTKDYSVSGTITGLPRNTYIRVALKPLSNSRGLNTINHEFDNGNKSTIELSDYVHLVGKRSREYAIKSGEYTLGVFVGSGATTPVASMYLRILDYGAEVFIEQLYHGYVGGTIDGFGQDAYDLSMGHSAANIVRKYFETSTFKNLTQKYTNEAYLSHLYLGIFGRGADRAGKEFWLKFMANGGSRKEVLEGFLYSKEFKERCSALNITY